jgi:hypothetical protein
MPPLPLRDLKKLVKKLGAGARPAQRQALETLSDLTEARNPDSLAAVAAVGAIPPLVESLLTGSPSDTQYDAAGILMDLADRAELAVTIAGAGAGAIPPLVTLGSASPADVREIAAGGGAEEPLIGIVPVQSLSLILVPSLYYWCSWCQGLRMMMPRQCSITHWEY